jgi:SAM-dependent methyltransferase
VTEALASVRTSVDSKGARCALCGRGDFHLVHCECRDRLHWLPGSFDIESCDGCGLLRTNPQLEPESIAGYYPSSYGSLCSAGDATRGVAGRFVRQAVRLPHVLRFGDISRTPPAAEGADHLLDIGCGVGRSLAQMTRLGWDPWGIEPRGAAARTACERLGVPDSRIFIGTAEEAEFPENMFDLVTMAHVLEHLSDPVGVLDKIHRWLRPRGELRIWLPNVASLESRVFGRLWAGLDVPRHLSHFSPETIRRALEGSGFSIERMVPQFGSSSLSLSLTHLVNALLGRQYRPSLGLTHGLLPLAGVLSALGYSAALEVTARRI